MNIGSVPDLHIAFGVDANYLPPMAAAIISIADNNPELELVFHVMATGFSQEDKDKLAVFAKEKALAIRLYDAGGETFSQLPDPSNLTRAVYNRFLICAALTGVASKVLYLDSDIICLGSLKALTSLPMGDKVLAAVEDVEQKKAKRAIGLPGDEPYFNSGVLYIDVEKWNAHSITDTLFNVLKEAENNFPLPDQDALNVALIGKVLFLERKWNLFIDKFPVTQETVFLHYNGRKPWQMWSEHYQDKRFTSALDRTPWVNWRFIPKSRKHKNKQAQYLLGKGRFIAGIYWYLLFMLTARKQG